MIRDDVLALLDTWIELTSLVRCRYIYQHSRRSPHRLRRLCATKNLQMSKPVK